MPVVWNDLIREVERIRRRKNQSPLSASWHRNVGIALKQCPFELAEATPEAIREWIDQMQDSGLSGLTINSKCSLLSSLVSKCMRSGLRQLDGCRRFGLTAEDQLCDDKGNCNGGQQKAKKLHC